MLGTIDVRGTHYWAWIATFYLIILTYQDYKNKRLVNERFNYVMLGVTISLISHYTISTLYLLALVFAVVALRYYLGKINVFGEADLTTLNWVFLGFGYINYIFLLGFILVFIICTLLYTMIKLYIFRYRNPTPFFSIILLCFWLTCFLFALY